MGSDGKVRCAWAGSDPLYCMYHDHEWGKPVFDDHRLFEKICLESFQAGISWFIILRKIPNFRRAFDNFDFEKIASYDRKKVEVLVRDGGIVRNQRKIQSVLNNARRAQEIVEEWGSLSRYFWSFQAKRGECHGEESNQVCEVNSVTASSVRLFRDLRKRGWTFVGPTICRAFMQSIGIINGHIEGCFCR